MSSIFAPAYTQELQEMIREIEVDPAEFLGAKYMPEKVQRVSQVFVSVLEARGGMTKEHTRDTDPQATNKRQFRVQKFSPGAYKEFIRFGEADILDLRDITKNDPDGRGIREWMNENAIALNARVETRIEYLRWQAILNGEFIYDNKVVDFGKLAAHDVAPTIPWGASANGAFTTPNAGADPISDLRFWLTGGYAPFRKYGMPTGIVMNGNTARMVLQNPKVQSLIQYRFASDRYDTYSVNSIMQFLLPGLPEFKIYNGWWQEETVDPISGLITVGDAEYFIPDGRIYFETKLPGGDTIGDFAMTLNLANGDLDNPDAGKFLIVDDKIKANPGNPYVDIFCGVYGGPRLKRGPDTLTATVI